MRRDRKDKRSRRMTILWMIFCLFLIWGQAETARAEDENQLPGNNVREISAYENSVTENSVQEISVREAGIQENAIPELSLYAQSAVLMDGDSGRILYEKNGYEVLPMASTTKIMTCILALENGDLDDSLTVSSYAASMPEVHLGVREGESYRLGDLLYSLMLESHNDTAVVVAEGVAGSVENFAAMMNQKARDIGAYDTFFVTPNGLDATALCRTQEGQTEERAHSTTAADLARILRYCIKESPKREEFLEITRTDVYQFTDGDGRRSFTCYNHNAFLDMLQGALTGKTGFTAKAGYCYVGAVEQDGELYIAALLACGWPNNKTYKWSDMRTLVNYGLENYEYRDVWREPELTEIPVEDGVPWDGSPDGDAYVALAADYEPGEGQLTLLLRPDEEVSMQVQMADSLTAPVRAKTAAGSVTYLLNGEAVKSYNLVTVRDVEKRDFAWCLRYVWELVSGIGLN